VPTNRFTETDLSEAVNVDIDNSGGISRRAGRVLKLACNARSLWASAHATLFAVGSELRMLNKDFTATVLQTGINAVNRLAYAQADHITFWTDGVNTGAVQEGIARTAGIATPEYQPLAAAIAGNLPAGTYQYALTFVRGDGQESGTGLAESITLTEAGGISFSGIEVSSDPGVTHKRIYMTSPDGEVLMLAHEMYNAVTSYSMQNKTRYAHLDLTTQFLAPPPPGDLLGYYKGRLYVVVGRVVFYSKPFSYELFDLRDYFILPETVTIFAPSEDGIFVMTEDDTWYLDGDEPEKMKLTKLDGTGGIAGTLTYVPISVMRDVLKLNYLSGNIPVWSSKTGINYGLPRGQVMNPIADKFTLQEGKIGASIYDNSNGINRYITSMFY
jgi:hypothetical protein